MPLAPYNRRELFLEAIRTRDTSALPDPNNREELFLKDIADQVAAIPTGIPVSVPAELSELLANLPEPHTHTERFYNDIIGALLVATTVTDTTPYITRVTAGGLPVTGTGELKKKLGNTVCVNQLARVRESRTVFGLTFTNNGDGTATISGQATSSGSIGLTVSINTLASRYYLVYGDDKGYRFTTNVSSLQLTIEVASGENYNVTCAPKIHDIDLWFGSHASVPSDLLSHPENWGRYYAGSLDYEPGRLVSADGTTLRSYDGNGNLLDVTDTGNELLRSAGAVADEKTPDGTITRRIGVVDLGELIWNYDDTTYPGSPYFYSSAISDAKASSVCKSAKYINDTSATASMPDKSYKVTSAKTVYLIDHSFTTAAALTTALSGIYLYYELATPTTEQGTDFNPGYAVEAGGTESWLQDQSTGVPQGHETEYKEFTT